MAVLDTISAGLEQVKPEFVDMSSYDNSLLGMIGPAGPQVQISRWGYRIPFLKYQGGTYVKISLDGGALATGTGPKMDHMVAGYIGSAYGVNITEEQIRTTENNQQSIVNALTEITTNIMRTMTAHDNIHFLGNGTGWLTNTSSAKPANNQLTFAGASDMLGVNQLIKGMAVNIWASDGTTLRANGPYTITDIDYESGVVTFHTDPTSLTSGDRLSVAGVTAYGPNAPTSYSSTWPGGGLTTAAGLTGDSWRHGLPYANDATGANHFLGKQKSSNPHLIPAYINASSHRLTWEMVELGKNKLIQSRDPSVLNGLMAVMHLAQVQVLKEAQVKIAKWDISSSEGKYFDMPPQIDVNQVFNLNGIPAFGSKLPQRDRVDFLNRTNWGKVQSREPDYYRAPDGSGNKFWPVLNGSGQYTLSWNMWILAAFDWVCHDPGASMYIANLAVPTGYRPTETFAG